MLTTFRGKKISGMLAVVPETTYDYDIETAHFATKQTKRLKNVMGFDKRRAAKANSTTGDFCHYAMQYLLDHDLVNIDEIGAIVVTGYTPDYFVPHNSNIIHGEFGFSQEVVCVDVPQGCCGFMMGLMQACMLLEHLDKKKVLVFTGNVAHRQNPEDKISEATFGGDAGSVTVVENNQDASDIFFNMRNDGAHREALIMHAGAYRMPRSPETAIPRDTGYGDGTKLPYDKMWMDGSMVFNFVQREVPLLIDEILKYAHVTREEIEIFFLHQPNKFMLQKLAQRMNVPFERVPMNVVGTFGNSAASTIPVNITYNGGRRLENEKLKCCLAGFGSGLTWSSAVMELGNLKFCRLIESNL